jgi:2-isopropylmalate synthase
LKEIKPFFVLEEFKVETDKEGKALSVVTARLRIKVQGKSYKAVGKGDGPINALDNALRKMLENIYPQIRSIKLTDYKVRVLNSEAGTAARVRVIIESADEKRSWNTVGVSTNVIDASWQALVDSIEYKLMMME